MAQRKRILFTGYAPVHFVCFLPAYRWLARDPDVELWLSGGFKHDGDDGEPRFDIAGFYDAFPVDREHVVPIERARNESYDVLVCSHLSDTLFPGAVSQTVQIFHGVSFKNLAVRDRALRFDFLCLPGRYHADLYRREGLVRSDGSRCLLTGFAKTDPLATRDAGRDVSRELGLDPSRRTILFAPTGEKHNALETMGEAAIEALRDARRFNVLVKPHDHPKRKIDWFERLAPLAGDHVHLIRDKDVVPYLLAADLLITDASSVALEYTLLDRPIVFIDVPRLLAKVQKKAPALDLDTYGRKLGRLVRSPDELVSTVDDALAHPEREAAVRRAAAGHLFHRPGSATARVAGVVRHAAGLGELPDDVEIVAPV